MNILSKLLLSAAFLLAANVSFALGEQAKEISIEERLAFVEETLPEQENTVMLFAKGLTCPSCAIGIRKKTSQLDFVDRERFNKGVDLNVEHQIASIALKAKAQLNTEALRQAIIDAGYDPVTLFVYRDKKVQAESLTKE